ncbi:hypothetical protein [Acinetobacter brisouii]|uniref:hypothetical protein n=1 Tax=Acinetobacter brisouii TaxID=396323 RepID=UPI0035B0C174
MNTSTIVVSWIALVISLCSFWVAFVQMRIASAKTKLDLYNKRFSIYVTALEYYQSTWHDPYDKIENKAKEFTKAFRESLFLFDKNSGIQDLLKKIQQNGSTISFYKKYKYESENNLTNDRLDLSTLHDASMKAQFEFEANLLSLEQQLENYLSFKSIDGWHFYK